MGVLDEYIGNTVAILIVRENPARKFLLFERTHVVPSRELQTVSFCADVIVLAPARTVKDVTGSSRFRSNSREG